jgi:nickel/cobalt exporter
MLLGLVVAITHTASVIVLGVASLFVASVWTDLVTGKFIGITSGAVIVVIGLWMLVTRSSGLLRGGAVPDAHDHTHDGQAHGHPHHSHHHHTPSLGEERQSLWQIMGLGISGGLIPCPAALVVLLASLRSGEIASGLTYLLVFSLGVAAVLVALGVAVCKATGFAARFLDRPWLGAVASMGSAVLIIGVGAFIVWQAASG